MAKVKISRLLISLILFGSGCTGTENIDTDLIGRCYELLTDAKVYKSNCRGSTGEFILFPEGLTPQNDICIRYDSDIMIPKNSILIVQSVLKQNRGSSGHCFRTTFTVGQGNYTFDVPSCKGVHPKPYWVMFDYKHPDRPSVNTDFLKTISCKS